jgi:diaminohydroxyphosphoribosylaminopyrimidine deaminase/5-amino-6-(5-phosphoribosylamino)uracil reductase
MDIDELYMQRCIDLARLGSGHVAPNPMVGAVIVHENRIIGEGYHQNFGEPHAEVHAIASVEDKSLLKDSTLYVSLEPCSHFGKTPPCSNLIIQNEIKRVVIGTKDTHLKVNGGGIEQLKKAGIDVTVGVLDQACRELNKRFFTFHERQRPYVILKWAQSADGFLDKLRNPEEKGIHWLSSPETKILVHKWRSEEQSIMVGRKTVQNDNPSLTVREYSGKNPIRIIIDAQLQVPENLNIFSSDAQTLVFNRIKNDRKDNIEWIKLNETNVETILHELYKRNISSVFVEGGSRTLHYFIFGNVWDEARVIVGNSKLYEGTRAPFISKSPIKAIPFSTDMIYFYSRK